MKSSVFACFLVFALIQSVFSYSISYFTNGNAGDIVNAIQLDEVLSETKAADIYLRVSGRAPISREEQILLPSRNVFSSVVDPVIYEVEGGYLSSKMTPVVTSSNGLGPSGAQISGVLSDYGYSTKVKSIQVDSNAIIDERLFVGEASPIFVVHKPSKYSSHRRLDSSYKPLTEFEISQYQIVLWTAVILIGLLISSVYMMVNMEVIPDSLLMAKFLSARTGKHD